VIDSLDKVTGHSRTRTSASGRSASVGRSSASRRSGHAPVAAV